MKNQTKASKVAVIITAAGSSTRMGGGIKKEFLPLKNGTVLSEGARKFLNSELKNNLSDLIITFPDKKEAETKNALFADSRIQQLLNGDFKNTSLSFVCGSDTRQKSVFKALDFLKNKYSEASDLIVLIHDGARPFVTEQVINEVAAKTVEYKACVPSLTPVDTLKQIDENGFISQHLKRSELVCVQTPQGFIFEPLYEAHKKALSDNKEYTDDTEIWGNYIGKVFCVKGDENNIKITYKKDLGLND